MVAFTGFDPIEKKREEDQSRYANYDRSKLEALGGQQNAPSGPTGPAASQGALGTPAPAGEGSAFGPPAPPSEEGQDFYSMFKGASPESRTRLADEWEQLSASQGLTPQGNADNVFRQHGNQAIDMAAKYGVYPSPALADELGLPKSLIPTTDEVPLGGDVAFEMAQDPSARRAAKARKEDEDAKADKQAKRENIAAFLMEFGLRTLASDKGGLQGAAGAFLDTQASRQGRAEAAEDRARRTSKEDKEEKRAASKEKRDAAKERRDQKKFEREMETGNLVEIVQKDGTVLYVPKKAGYVYDENGQKVRKATAQDLSAAQHRTSERQDEGHFQTERRAIQKSIDEAEGDPDYFEEGDPRRAILQAPAEERQAMIEALAEERIGKERPGYDSDDDPMGLR
jgi:hypothetical protein